MPFFGSMTRKYDCPTDQRDICGGEIHRRKQFRQAVAFQKTHVERVSLIHAAARVELERRTHLRDAGRIQRSNPACGNLKNRAVQGTDIGRGACGRLDIENNVNAAYGVLACGQAIDREGLRGIRGMGLRIAWRFYRADGAMKTNRAGVIYGAAHAVEIPVSVGVQNGRRVCGGAERRHQQGRAAKREPSYRFTHEEKSFLISRAPTAGRARVKQNEAM